MPNKSAPEDFKNVENKFKLSLLNIEKRFVELEVAISDLNDKLKAGKFESLKDINKRMSEIEDLILVEQAGLVELKNLMEGADSKFKTVQDFNDRMEKKVEDKLAVIKKKVTSAEEVAKAAEEKAEMPSSLNETDEQRVSLIEQDVAKLKTRSQVETVSPLEIGNIRSKMKNLRKKIELIEESLGDLKASIDMKVKKSVEEGLRGPTGKGADFEFIKARLDVLKSGVGKLNDKSTEADRKIGEIEEKVSALDNRTRDIPKTAFDEIKMAKRDLGTAKVRIESLENVVRELTSNLNEVENKAKKFQSLEQLTNLKEDVDNRLRRFKGIEDEISKLSSRVEVIYNDLDKRMMGMKNQEKDIKRVSESAKEFVKDLEKVKFDIKSKADKKELGRFMNEVETRSKRIEEIVKGNIGKGGEPSGGFKVVSDLNTRVSEVEKALEMIQSSLKEVVERPESNIYDARVNELVDKFVFLETRLSTIEAILQKSQPIILE